MFNFKSHECLKELSNLLKSDSEYDIYCLQNTKNNLNTFNKLTNKSCKIGSLYFEKMKKGYEFQLLLIQGVTLIKEKHQSNEFIFIRSSDLDYL